MPRKRAPGTRERILEAASRLFQEHGVQGVGLQQVIDECGCGKNLLYREFPSKDAVVVAYLRRCRHEWEAAIDQAIQLAENDPAERLVAVVRGVAAQVSAADYRGCPFLNTRAEFRDPQHPAHQVAVEHFEALRRQLHGLAEQAELRDPPAVAERLLLIVYGLYATGFVLGSEDTVPNAVALAEQTVRASGSTRSAP
jgi:AcrR family transcriptional regulator